MTGSKVGEMHQIKKKVISGELKLNFFGPAGGLRTRKGAFALQSKTIWVVETEIAFSVEQQYFLEQQAKKIVAKVLGDFSKFCLTKMVISRDPV